jgi:hypothetical protein
MRTDRFIERKLVLLDELIEAAAVIALVIEAIQTTPSSRKVRVAKSGGLFDRPEACHPIEYDAKREAEITHLNVVLRLLRAREQSRGQRAHLRQGGGLIGQLSALGHSGPRRPPSGVRPG